MTNRNLKNILFSVFGLMVMAVFFISGCGGADPDRSTKAQELRDRANLLKTYNAVAGRYTGTLTLLSGEDVPVEINLYVVERRDGADIDGNPVLRPELKSRFRRLNVIDELDDSVLDARYFPESGEIIMVSGMGGSGSGASSGGAGSSSSLLSIRGRILGESLTTDVTKNGGLWGYLSANRVSRQPSAPGDGAEADRRRRLREIFNQVTGTYEGQVQRGVGSGSYRIEIALYVIEVRDGLSAGGEPSFRPKLVGRYRTLDMIGEADNQILETRYYPETGEIVMDASETVFTIRAIARNGALKNGEILNGSGLFGTFSIPRSSSEVRAPEEGMEEESRRRLRAEYESHVGVYRGEILTPDREIHPVEVTLFVVEEPDGQTREGQARFLPALRARYKRLDFNSGIGERFLSVRYFPLTRSVVMRDHREAGVGSGGGAIPGSGLFSISGRMDAGRIDAAEVIDHRGFVGTLNAVRRSPR